MASKREKTVAESSERGVEIPSARYKFCASFDKGDR
jgi:hypothetical protein